MQRTKKITQPSKDSQCNSTACFPIHNGSGNRGKSKKEEKNKRKQKNKAGSPSCNTPVVNTTRWMVRIHPSLRLINPSALPPPPHLPFTYKP